MFGVSVQGEAGMCLCGFQRAGMEGFYVCVLKNSNLGSGLPSRLHMHFVRLVLRSYHKCRQQWSIFCVSPGKLHMLSLVRHKYASLIIQLSHTGFQCVVREWNGNPKAGNPKNIVRM